MRYPASASYQQYEFQTAHIQKAGFPSQYEYTGSSDYHFKKMKEMFYLEQGYPVENMFNGPPHKRPFDGPQFYNEQHKPYDLSTSPQFTTHQHNIQQEMYQLQEESTRANMNAMDLKHQFNIEKHIEQLDNDYEDRPMSKREEQKGPSKTADLTTKAKLDAINDAIQVNQQKPEQRQWMDINRMDVNW